MLSLVSALILSPGGYCSRLYWLEQQSGGRLSSPVLLFDIEQHERSCAQFARSIDACAVWGSHVLHDLVAVHSLVHHFALRRSLSQDVWSKLTRSGQWNKMMAILWRARCIMGIVDCEKDAGALRVHMLGVKRAQFRSRTKCNQYLF